MRSRPAARARAPALAYPAHAHPVPAGADVLRSGTHAGLLYKAQRGTRHGWTRRWFVLEDLSIMYFAPNEALLKAEREAQRQREARSNSGDFGAREMRWCPRGSP